MSKKKPQKTPQKKFWDQLLLEQTPVDCPRCSRPTVPEVNMPKGMKPYMIHTDTFLTICNKTESPKEKK